MRMLLGVVGLVVVSLLCIDGTAKADDDTLPSTAIYLDGTVEFDRAQVVAAVRLDVAEAYGKQDEVSTPLKRKTFVASDEYKQLLADLKVKRTEVLTTRYVVKEERKVTPYDLKRKQFLFLFDDSETQFRSRSCLGGVCFPTLALQSVQEKSAGCDWGGRCSSVATQYIAFKTTEQIGLVVEAVSSVDIYYVFSVDRVDGEERVVAKNVISFLVVNADGRVLSTVGVPTRPISPGPKARQ